MHLVTNSWSLSQAHSNNTRAQKKLAIAHYRIGVSTQSTWAKHFNNASTITLLTHHHTRYTYSESALGEKWRYFNIKFWGNQLTGFIFWQRYSSKLLETWTCQLLNLNDVQSKSDIRAFYISEHYSWTGMSTNLRFNTHSKKSHL